MRAVLVFEVGNRYVVLDPSTYGLRPSADVTFDSTFTTDYARVMQ